MALTRITKGVIKPNENYDTHNINSTGIVTAIGLDVNGNADVSGSLSVGGVLTYEDVTSIDSVGIITARSGVDVDDFVSVGSNIHLGNAGVVTATSFVGSGAALTGIDATAIKDSGGNVKVQAQASGAVYTGIHTFNSDLDVDGHTNLDNVSVAGVSTFSDNVRIVDDKKLLLGDSNDLQLYHDSSTGHSTIKETGSGVLSLHTNGSKITLFDSTNSRLMAEFIVDGACKFRHAGNGTKLETTSTGVTIDGTIVATGADINGDIDVDGHTNLDNVSIAGVSTFSKNIILPDSSDATDGRIKFGGSSDLMLYHYGGANYIDIQNTLNIRGPSGGATIKIKPKQSVEGIIVVPDGSVELYEAGVKKLETSSLGIKVGTGVTVETNGQATFTGIVTASAFKLSDGSNVGGIESDAQSNTIGGTDAGINLDSDTYSNTFFGHSSGKQINSGDGNTALGQYSLQNGTSATGNSVLGYSAGRAIISGNHNTLLGYEAGTALTTAGDSVAVGYRALKSATDKGYNVAVGRLALENCNGEQNTAVGNYALNSVTSGKWNTGVGGGAIHGCTGQDNTGIGRNSGNGATISGSNNILIGHDSQLSSTSVSNEVVIGDSNINHVRVPGIGVSFSEGGAVISGIVTATSFSGSGANLTGINADLVNDSSPQLGGDLASNSHDILFADNDKAIFGTGSDFKIYHNGTDNYIMASNGHIRFDTGSAELARITSDGKLLVGTQTEGQVGADDLTLATSGNTGITIRSGTSNAGNIYFSDATSGSAEYAGYVSYSHSTNSLSLGTNDGTERLRIDSVGQVLPGSDNAQNLGSSTKRWANIYSADIHCSNKGSSNNVDGTWGDFTIQEGESDLFLLNNRNGKKYKFNLTEVN